MSFLFKSVFRWGWAGGLCLGLALGGCSSATREWKRMEHTCTTETEEGPKQKVINYVDHNLCGRPPSDYQKNLEPVRDKEAARVFLQKKAGGK